MKSLWAYNLMAVGFVVVLGGVLGTVWVVSRPQPVDAVVPAAVSAAPAQASVRPSDTTVEAPAALSPGDALLAEVMKIGPAEGQLLSDAAGSIYGATDALGDVVQPAQTAYTPPASPAPATMPSSSSSTASAGSGSGGSDTSGTVSGSTLSAASGASGGSSGGGSSDGSSDTSADAAATETASAPTATTPTSTGGGVAPISNDLTKPQNIGDIFWLTKEVTKNQRLLPLSTAMENLLKYDAFWTTAKFAELYPQAWRTLRTEHPDKLAMHYITPFTVRTNGGASNIDIDYIEKYHPEWFLLKDEKNATAQDYRNSAKRMRWNSDDPKDYNYHRFFLDVGNPSFQDWAVREFLKKLDPVSGINARIRYSGIVADNVLLTVWVNGKTKLYPNWKYAENSSQWNQAYFSYLKKLHDALQKEGYVLIVNHTTDYSSNRDGSEWQDLMAVVDGMADEQALMSSNGLFGGEMWEWSLKHHEDTITRGLYDWWIFTPDTVDSKNEFHQFLYVYGSFLLVRNEDFSLFGTVRRHDGVEMNPWYEEYNIPLGNPVSFRYQQQGCWMRDFQYGKVVVNPSNVRAVIPLGTETYTLDWKTKKQITQLTLEPQSATILLPTGYSLR